jgi:hypothetical protein
VTRNALRSTVISSSMCGTWVQTLETELTELQQQILTLLAVPQNAVHGQA